jgi:hypothetical protein
MTEEQVLRGNAKALEQNLRRQQVRLRHRRFAGTRSERVVDAHRDELSREWKAASASSSVVSG